LDVYFYAWPILGGNPWGFIHPGHFSIGGWADHWCLKLGPPWRHRQDAGHPGDNTPVTDGQSCRSGAGAPGWNSEGRESGCGATEEEKVLGCGWYS